MRRPKLTYLILSFLVFISQTGFGEVFTVVSPNPSGPGTLRDAIEKANANGTREMDYIYFDIPVRTRDKTIYLRPTTLLPTLTSFITIDGTTQPGDKLGVTDAKTMISIEGAYAGTDNVICFNLTQASNVFIYGIVIKANVADRSTGQPPPNLYGIYTESSSNIGIGAAGKGNVISGWNKAIFNEFNARFPRSGQMTIQSNYFGLDIDGVSMDFGGRTGGKATNANGVYIAESFGPVRIGGNADEETNYFNSTNIDVFIEGEFNTGTDRGLTITNNRFGMGFRDQNLNSNTGVGIRITHMSTWLAGFPPILISRNLFGGLIRGIAIQADHLLPRFLINQNIIGYEENGQKLRDADYGIGIYVNECENGIIGGTNPTLANTIRYQSLGAIVCDATRDISIFQNSTYCNRKRAIELRNWHPFNNVARPKPFVTINQINETFGVISGKAPRLSTIELFNDDDCPGCEGKTFFARTTSDANGNWNYRGSFRGGSIIATASDQGNATSEYSAPEIDTSSMIKPAIVCNGQLASICGLKIISGTRWQWEDAGGNVLGTDTCLNNVPPGEYFFRLAIGSNSCEELFRFEVRDSLLKIDTSRRIDITHNRCGRNNGTIRGFQPVNASSWRWEDFNGNIVGTDIELRNVPAGRYRFRVFNRSCDTVSAFYEIVDVSPRIVSNNTQIVPSTCNLNNGSITGISLSGENYSTLRWYDLNRNVVGTTKDLLNVPAGSYKLVVRDNQEGCGDSTGFIIVPATPSLQIDTAILNITAATCNLANGSIKNLGAINSTGNIAYRWVNDQDSTVGNTPDLLNIPPGIYRLKMKDAGPCDTIVSRAFVIINNGNVSIDSGAVSITPTGCTRINGSIRGIRINGADSWEWRNTATNNIVSTSLDLVNMPAGTYRLFARSLSFGCVVESNTYTIGTAQMIPIGVTQVSVRDAICNINNGFISVTGFNASQSLFSFRWLKDSVEDFGNNLSLTNLAPATYHLIATDTNGCRRAIYKQIIGMLSSPVLDERSVTVTGDTCGFKTGSIRNVIVSGGSGDINYSWINGSNRTVGTTTSLTGAEAGQYRLEVRDQNGCADTGMIHTINQVVVPLPKPAYDDLTIPRNTDAAIRVKNFRDGASYELYDLSTGILIDKNNTGNFVLPRVPEDRTVTVKLVSGPCSSTEVQVNIKVLDVTKLEIPNAFSPNGDGINETFKIRVTGYFRLDALKIFNRWGQQVFESRDLGLEWKGDQNGKPLPVGTYYWTIEGLDVYGKKLKQVGSITILR